MKKINTLSLKNYNEILLRSKQGLKQVTIQEVKSVYYRIMSIKNEKQLLKFSLTNEL